MVVIVAPVLLDARDMPIHPDFRDLLAVFAAHDVDQSSQKGKPAILASENRRLR